MISIICPTIDGREHWLERCHQSYCETTDDFEFIVIRNRPSCGIGWNDGYVEANGDFIHLTADDIEATPGWWQVGIEWIEKGYLPAARILNTDGTLQSCGDDASEQPTGTPTEVARIPFCSREQMECICPILETHYGTDYYFSYRGKECGWPSVVVREFLFYHHFAQEGRNEFRFEDDMEAFYAETVR